MFLKVLFKLLLVKRGPKRTDGSLSEGQILDISGKRIIFSRDPFSGHLTKTLLIMRLTAIFLLAACLQANAKSYGQTISLSETNTSLLKVFKQIRKQSGYEFWYEDKLM